MDTIALINQILPITVVIAEVAAGILGIALVAAIFGFGRARILGFAWKHGLFLSLVVALAATLGSLFYSEVEGLEPCKLCWYSRIFTFPQALLLAIALWREDRSIAYYVLPMSVIGALIATYHFLLQFGFVPPPPCSVGGFSVSCAEKSFVALGYITIPVMAFSAFALLALLQALLMLAKKDAKGSESLRE